MKKTLVPAILLTLVLLHRMYAVYFLEPQPDYIRMYNCMDNMQVHSAPGLRSPVVFLLSEGEDVYFTGNKSRKLYRERYKGKIYKSAYYEIQNWEGKTGWVHSSTLKCPSPAPDSTYINMPILDKSFVRKILPAYKHTLVTNGALFIPLEGFDICFPFLNVNREQFYYYKDSYFYVLNYSQGGEGEPLKNPFLVFQKNEISDLRIEYKISATLYLEYGAEAGVWKSRDIPDYDSPWASVIEKGSLMYVFTETLGHHSLLSHIPPEAFILAEQEKLRIWSRQSGETTVRDSEKQKYQDFMRYYPEISNLQLRVSWTDKSGSAHNKSINFYYQHQGR